MLTLNNLIRNSFNLIRDTLPDVTQGSEFLTMTEIRRSYWISKLIQLTKRIIWTCHGCRRFHATAYAAPISGQLPPGRTNGRRSFQVIGLDFAGPIIYKGRKDSPKQAYVFLITYSLSRAVHRVLVGNQKMEEFIRAFKRFMERRGKPERIYSDNAKTFKVAATWIKSIRKSELIYSYLMENHITWQFNLSKAPWWGDQFE